MDETNKTKLNNAKRVLVILGPLIAAVGGFAIGAGVTPVAAAPVVGLVGFGPNGPKQGTLAAKLQPPEVKAGSYFAVAQSIGMGGPVPFYGAILGGLILSLITFVVFLVIRALARMYYKKRYARPARREKEGDHLMLRP